jgi:nucleotide-binding universal stress UspA family protein
MNGSKNHGGGPPCHRVSAWPVRNRHWNQDPSFSTVEPACPWRVPLLLCQRSLPRLAAGMSQRPRRERTKAHAQGGCAGTSLTLVGRECSAAEHFRAACARQPAWWKEVTAMRSQGAGRVVVGVDDSLAGLQALREAVTIARQRGMEVLAVRACCPMSDGASFDCWPAAGRGPAFVPLPPLLDAERQGVVFVEYAFSEAMGGIPGDVAVRTIISYERPHQALTATASKEADLLVLGASRRHPWWPFRRSPGRYCAANAVCPVLIVPPHQGIRELDRMRRPRYWLRRKREFSSLAAGVSRSSRD